ncbi:MAG: hypothetical protein OEY85_10125, partial [Rhodospirillales bacterium]|nr:hypothetical protein [Rhodospirillales bacterium]
MAHDTSTDQKKSALRRTFFFAAASEAVLDGFAAAAAVRQAAAGETLCEKGAPGDCIYVIMDGTARVHDGNLALKT